MNERSPGLRSLPHTADTANRRAINAELALKLHRSASRAPERSCDEDLRNRFAIAALAGLITGQPSPYSELSSLEVREAVAKTCYAMADAMLTAARS